MQAVRKVPQSLARVSRSSIRPSRRFASTEHGHEHAHHDAHHGPVDEPLGSAFYIAAAAIPLSLAVYSFSRPEPATDRAKPDYQPWFTRYINSYSQWMEKWKATNSLHTDMIEQAAQDRHLFQYSKGSSTINLRYPEIVNGGSPYNVPAGHGSANLDKLIAHYESQRAEDDERKLRKLASP